VSADDVIEVSLLGQVGKDCEQVRFAVEASVGLVGGIVWVDKLVRLDGLDFGAHIFCHLDCVVVLGLGQSGTCSGTGEDIFGPEGIEGGLEQEGAVDAARVCDDDFAEVF